MESERNAHTPFWFYESGGRQAGPVQPLDIERLIKTGSIHADTLVWRKGLADWAALRQTELHEAFALANTSQKMGNNGSDEGWYYELDGLRHGPVAASQMQRLITIGTLAYGSMVWRAGMSAWTAVEHSPLSTFIEQVGPPPLESDAIRQTVVWILAFAPLISLVLQMSIALQATNGDQVHAVQLVSNGTYWYIGPLLSIPLSYWDVAILRKAGVNTRALGQAWLVPLYLFKRAKALQHSAAYFWVWLCLFCISVLAR